MSRRRQFSIDAGFERPAAFERVRAEEAMVPMAGSVVEVSA